MSSSTPEGAALWDAITLRQAEEADSARQALTILGVQYAHPDDGWVRRNPDGSGTHTVSWYPLFDNRPEVGDLIAFGYPYPTEHAVLEYTSEGGLRADAGYRIVRVTEVERRHGILGYHQSFEFVFEGQTWPPERLSRWRRRPVRKHEDPR